MSQTLDLGWNGRRQASAVGHAGAVSPPNTDSVRRATDVEDPREDISRVTLR